MKSKSALLFLVTGIAVLALAGCQALPNPQGASAQPAAATATTIPTATQLPKPIVRPTATAIPTADPIAAPTAAAEAYAAALQSGDFQTAADLLSEFSLTYAGLTRGEAEIKLANAAGSGSYALVNTRLLHPDTALVDVQVTPASDGVVVEETWVFRQENGLWLYNLDNLIDTRSLDADVQTTGGITLKPRTLVRFSDRIRLELLAQNQTSDFVTFGQSNEILAAFHFGSETVEAEADRITIEPLRSYPSVALEVKGKFESFPDSVDIRIWKDYQVDPWYSFDLTR